MFRCASRKIICSMYDILYHTQPADFMNDTNVLFKCLEYQPTYQSNVKPFINKTNQIYEICMIGLVGGLFCRGKREIIRGQLNSKKWEAVSRFQDSRRWTCFWKLSIWIPMVPIEKLEQQHFLSRRISILFEQQKKL